MHRTIFRRTEATGDARDAATAFLAGAATPASPALTRATAAINAGRIAAEAGHGDQADAGFGTAVTLLARLAWPGLPRDDQEDLLRRFAHLAPDAAAWALERGDPERAVELAEQGRGVLLAQAIDARSPYDLLHAAAPDLADRLRRIYRELDATGSGDEFPLGSGRRDAEHRMALAAERDGLIEEIDARGLTPLVAPPRFVDLRNAASDGPVVVVNISRYRCDALAVTSSGVQAIPLDITAEHVREHASALISDTEDDLVEQIIGWLAQHVVEPVTTALELSPSSRLWWCPTDLLGFLPLHAAALDHAVSSYTPSLRALLHARARLAPHESGEPEVLVVSMPETPGADPLPAATREGKIVRRYLPRATSLDRPSATVKAVTEAIGTAAWMHFICHGRQDLADPSQGRLLLHDGPLTVRRLSGERAVRARLAVLSACETYRSATELADEAISLAAAFQLAGFPHVVGTLWAAHDSVAVRFIKGFYQDMRVRDLDVAGCAEAVHATVLRLRDRYGTARAWAPFIHVGP